MRRTFIAIVFAFTATTAAAQSVAALRDGSFIVAHDGVVERYASNLHERLWRSPGVAEAGPIVIGARSAAVLDPLGNRVVIVDLGSGSKEEFRTGETPVGGAFIGSDLYVLDRDSRIVERFSTSGARATVPVVADAAFLRATGNTLLVYGRTSGAIQQITTQPFAVARTIAAPPFASDFEADDEAAYLVYPRDRAVRSISFESGKDLGAVRVGSVPTDLTFASSGTALTAAQVAIADPSAKRVWIYPKKESFTAALGRSFLRGLLGMTLFEGTEVPFESGVDRVVIHGSSRAAYDSASGTLYSFNNKKSTVLARGVSPLGFAAVDNFIVWWQNGTLVAQKVNR